MTQDVGPSVELVFSPECPNVDLARGRLAEALRTLGHAPVWTEWNRDDAAAPDYVLRFGSPTILVEGRDVSAAPPCFADSCRMYPSSDGFDRAPSVEALIAALCRQE